MHLDSVALSPDGYPEPRAYPFCLPVFQAPWTLDLRARVTMLVGENGTGKSTLLEAIAHLCHIHIWQTDNRVRYQHNPHEGDLYRHLKVHWSRGPVPGSFFAGEFFRDFAKLLDEWARADPGLLKYFGGKSLLEQSHGQALMSFFRSRYQLEGLYLLDEPETALSPQTQLELAQLIAGAGSSSAQFLIATHSPILMACPDAVLYGFDGARITRTRYQDTGHFRLYRDFMADPRRFL